MLNDNELALAKILITALDLEDLAPEDIKPDAPLFGYDAEDSLGLDSIDALEISLAVAKHFTVQLKADDDENHAIFSSLRTLSNHIQANR